MVPTVQASKYDRKRILTEEEAVVMDTLTALGRPVPVHHLARLVSDRLCSAKFATAISRLVSDGYVANTTSPKE